jgi:hypothetical protein
VRRRKPPHFLFNRWPGKWGEVDPGDGRDWGKALRRHWQHSYAITRYIKISIKSSSPTIPSVEHDEPGKVQTPPAARLSFGKDIQYVSKMKVSGLVSGRLLFHYG